MQFLGTLGGFCHCSILLLLLFLINFYKIFDLCLDSQGEVSIADGIKSNRRISMMWPRYSRSLALRVVLLESNLDTRYSTYCIDCCGTHRPSHRPPRASNWRKHIIIVFISKNCHSPKCRKRTDQIGLLLLLNSLRPKQATRSNRRYQHLISINEMSPTKSMPSIRPPTKGNSRLASLPN